MNLWLEWLGKWGIIPVSNCVDYCSHRNQTRIYQLNKKEMDSLMHERKQRQAIRKRYGNQDEEKGAKTYGAGEFYLLSYIYSFVRRVIFVI